VTPLLLVWPPVCIPERRNSSAFRASLSPVATRVPRAPSSFGGDNSVSPRSLVLCDGLTSVIDCYLARSCYAYLLSRLLCFFRYTHRGFLCSGTERILATVSISPFFLGSVCSFRGGPVFFFFFFARLSGAGWWWPSSLFPRRFLCAYLGRRGLVILGAFHPCGLFFSLFPAGINTLSLQRVSGLPCGFSSFTSGLRMLLVTHPPPRRLASPFSLGGKNKFCSSWRVDRLGSFAAYHIFRDRTVWTKCSGPFSRLIAARSLSP